MKNGKTGQESGGIIPALIDGWRAETAPLLDELSATIADAPNSANPYENAQQWRAVAETARRLALIADTLSALSLTNTLIECPRCGADLTIYAPSPHDSGRPLPVSF